jgi:hypothetical protein
MARGLGRVLVGGKDSGAAFALSSRIVVTAHHVVRGRSDKPVMYVPATAAPIGVERIQPDVGHDAAILWLESDAPEILPTSAAAAGASWRVESPPQHANDPHLHGTVVTARMAIRNAQGQLLEVAQLQAEEQLGDFAGYSGSAVLDPRGQTVLAMLIEQKPTRIAVAALGERRAASNVLYAVPVRDVITACGLPVQAAMPLRFAVGPLPPGMVTRAGLLDEAVAGVIAATGGSAGAGLVLLRGPGGRGKTVLAGQVADDMRVWAEFAGGIVMLRAGQAATPDALADRLQDTVGTPVRHLADALDGQRLLLIVDDVWDRELLATLRASLPPAVTVLATTRGVTVPGAAAVPVGSVDREAAIQILARGTARSSELDQALADLAMTLFHWALLLTLAAAEIHRDDAIGSELRDEQDAQLCGTDPGLLIRRARILRAEFPDDPTMLDELARTAEGAAPRSVEVLIRRSMDWLDPEHRARFEALAIYPSGATITQPVLEDLWGASQYTVRKEIRLLAQAGLARPVQLDWPAIEVHDLITAWLHHEHGPPGDVRHQPDHLRLAGLCLFPDGSPGKLTRSRADWLVHHLVSAGAWDGLTALPTLRWRSAYLVATGSDAAFLAALHQYGDAARARAPDGVYDAVRAWLFAAHVTALIGALPVDMLVVMAVAGHPTAAIAQAGQHPSAGRAVPAVLGAVIQRDDYRLLIEQAMAVAEALPDDRQRADALAGIATVLAAAAASDQTLIARALAAADTIPDDRGRSRALSGIATVLARAADDPAQIERALAVADSISDDWHRSEALTGIAVALVEAAGSEPALIERALAVAESIHDSDQRGLALAEAATVLAGAAADQPALIERALAIADSVSDDWQYARTLIRIAGPLAGAAVGNPALIKRTLAAAETIPGDASYSEALTSIARKLASSEPAQAAALIERALAVAEAIPDEDERSRALARIAIELADGTDSELVGRALTVAEAIVGDEPRSEALAEITTVLAGVAVSDPTLIARAVAVAEIIRDEDERSRALVGIAMALAHSTDSGLTERALAVAEAIPGEEQRSQTLVRIATVLAGAAPDDPRQVERALALAEAVADGEGRIGAIARLATELAVKNPAQTAALIDRALAAAEGIPGDSQRGRALARIAGLLASAGPHESTLLEQALAVAQTIPRDSERAEALAGIARELTVSNPARAAALIERAIAAARTIRMGERRCEALARTVRVLAESVHTDSAVMEQALAIAQVVRRDARGEVLAAIATPLARAAAGHPALIEQALAVAETIPTGRRGEVLAAMATALARAAAGHPALIEQALAVAETIPAGQRGEVLASIGAELVAIEPAKAAALLERALGVGNSLPGDWQRSRSLARIACALASATGREPAMFERALAVAASVSDDWQRAAAMAGTAEQLAVVDPVQARAVFARAMAAARSIGGVQLRSFVLGKIAIVQAGAAASDHALIAPAKAVAHSIPSAERRSEVLAEIAAALAGAAAGDHALIEPALAVADSIPSAERRSRALAEIATTLASAAAGDHALIEQAKAVANSIRDDEYRSEAVARVRCVTESGMLDELSRWRTRSLGASIDMVNIFLSNCEDGRSTKGIGLGILHAAADFEVESNIGSIL